MSFCFILSGNRWWFSGECNSIDSILHSLKWFSIARFSRKGGEVDTFYRSDIDRASRDSLVFSFAETLHTTCLAKSMSEFMRIESVIRHRILTRYELHISRRDECEEKSFYLTARTVTFEDGFREIEFDRVFYNTAVANSGVSRHKNNVLNPRNYTHLL